VKIDDVVTIKNRGTLIVVLLEAELGPQPLDTVVRLEDGVTWTITGVEWWAMPRSPTRPGKGDRVGLLLRSPATPLPGDEIEIRPATAP
jgi:hypothetical protein